jgi:hypothetical protein
LTEIEDIKVRIRNADGNYLTGDSVRCCFTADCAKALLFDYLGDGIEQKLELIARTQGLILKAVPVEAKEFLEICDHCQRLIAPSQAFFDGYVFLCRACRRRMKRRQIPA